MAGPKATARSPALRRSVPASDLDLSLSALGTLTWGLTYLTRKRGSGFALGRSHGPLVDLHNANPGFRFRVRQVPQPPRRSATVPMGRSSGPGAPPS